MQRTILIISLFIFLFIMTPSFVFGTEESQFIDLGAITKLGYFIGAESYNSGFDFNNDANVNIQDFLMIKSSYNSSFSFNDSFANNSHIYSPNIAVFAGFEQEITSSSTLLSGLTLNHTSVRWSQTSGPSEASILNPFALETQVDNLIEGTYEFELRIMNQTHYNEDSILIKVTDELSLLTNQIPQSSLPSRIWQNILWRNPFTNQWKLVDVGHTQISPDNADNADDFINLLGSLEEPTVLFFPEGNYSFSSSMSPIRESNFILKGASHKTVFILDNEASLMFSGAETGGTQDVALQVDSGSFKLNNSLLLDLQKGDVVRVSQEIEEAATVWGKHSNGGVFEIVNASNEFFWLDFPLFLGLNKSMNTSIVKYHAEYGSNFGIEDLTIRRASNGEVNTIVFNRVTNAYVKNVHLFDPAKNHMVVDKSRNVVIENNYFKGARNIGGGGNGYGVSLGQVSSKVKISNNIFEDMRHHIIVATGTNYNVISYNYIIDPLRELCIENPLLVECEYSFNRSQESTISVHGHMPHTTLWEGNVFYFAYTDAIWGANGPQQTFYRNLIKGQPRSWHNWQEGKGIVFANSEEQVAVGNYFLYNASISGATSKMFIGANNLEGEVVLGNLSDQDIPNSLYISSKPIFWNNNSWPPFGPDEYESQIPAQKRWEEIK